jgi:hypothetical protein
VGDPEPSPLLSEDWSGEFDQNLADACDMSQRLLDALRRNLNDLSWPVDEGFHDAFVASLRDLANYGLSQAPNDVVDSQQQPRARVADALLKDIPAAELAIKALAINEPLATRRC